MDARHTDEQTDRQTRQACRTRRSHGVLVLELFEEEKKTRATTAERRDREREKSAEDGGGVSGRL